MNTFHARLPLVAIAVTAILLASGCKTNSSGGGAPSTPSPTSSPSGSPSPSTGGSPSSMPSTPSPAPSGGAPSLPGGTTSSPMPGTPSTGTASMPSTSTGSTASLPSGGDSGTMGKPSGSAMPQSGSSNGGGASGSADSGRAQTPEERRGAIDKRLDDTLGTFDGEIRKEQERNAQERDARNAANAGSGSAETDSDSASDEDEDEDTKREGDLASGGTAEGPDGKSDRPNRAGDLKSEKDRKKSDGQGSGGSQGNSGGDAKTEIPDGSDDDVVARRLRKAAETETDPELKEKLWKEYIEYKKNAR